MTKRAGPSDGDDAAAFAEAVRGARALAGARLVPPEIGRPSGRPPNPRRPPQRTPATQAPSSAPLVVEETAQGWTARADGVDRRVLRTLRDPATPLEAQVDLHGLTRVKALDALGRFLSTSRASGKRRLLVIHGRGLHSGHDGPTLMDVVREALTNGAHAAAVLACTPAPPSRGGAGATVVYLRR